MLEDLPQEIKDHILRKVNDGNYQSKPNTYSLTELLYCLRRAYFRRKNPKPFDLETAFSMYRGRVFDDLWTPLFSHNQVRATYRCRGVPITISGKYDFLTSDDPPILTDLKTTKSLYFVTEPNEEYVKQVRFYAYLNSIARAQILYVDFGDCKVFPVEVGDCTGLLAELEANAASLYYALRYGCPPPRTISSDKEWVCAKCEYQAECNTP